MYCSLLLLFCAFFLLLLFFSFGMLVLFSCFSSFFSLSFAFSFFRKERKRRNKKKKKKKERKKKKKKSISTLRVKFVSFKPVYAQSMSLKQKNIELISIDALFPKEELVLNEEIKEEYEEIFLTQNKK